MRHASQPTRTDARTSPPTHSQRREPGRRCRRRRASTASARSRPGPELDLGAADARSTAPRELVFDRGPVRRVVDVTDDVDVGRAQRPRAARGASAGGGGCRSRADTLRPAAVAPHTASKPGGNGVGAPRSGSVCTQIDDRPRRTADRPRAAAMVRSAQRGADAAAPRASPSTSARKRGVAAMRSVEPAQDPQTHPVDRRARGVEVGDVLHDARERVEPGAARRARRRRDRRAGRWS